MRWTTATGLLATALTLSLAGCPADNGDPPTVFNNLPEVRAVLNDADPLIGGASINLDISDRDGEQCALSVEFSLDDGETYEDASVPQISGGNLHELSCPESGKSYSMVWDSEADLDGVLATRVLLRFQVEDAKDPGPPSHLLIPLVTTDVEVGGEYVTRPNAQGAEWGFMQMFMVNIDVQVASVTTTGLFLDGGDTFINNGDLTYSWRYDLPTPPPEEHFQVLDGDGLSGEGEAAIYLPTAFSDEDDPSGDYIKGNPIVGVSVGQMVVYVRPDGDWTEEGWHVLDFDIFEADSMFTPMPIDTPVPLLLKSYPVEKGDVILDVSVTAIDAQPRRCGLMPLIDGTQIPSNNYEMTSIPFDPIPSVMTMPVEAGWIKGSHWSDEDSWPNFVENFAQESFYLYRDLDQSEDASYQEPASHIGKHLPESRPLSLFFLDGEMTLDNLFLWTVDDCWQGFNLVTQHEKVIPKPPEDPYYLYACHPLDPGLTIDFLEL